MRTGDEAVEHHAEVLGSLLGEVVQATSSPTRLGVSIWQDSVQVLPDDDGSRSITKDVPRMVNCVTRLIGEDAPGVHSLDEVEVQRANVAGVLLGRCPADDGQTPALRQRPSLEAKTEAAEFIPSIVAAAAETQSLKQPVRCHPPAIVPDQTRRSYSGSKTNSTPTSFAPADMELSTKSATAVGKSYPMSLSEPVSLAAEGAASNQLLLAVKTYLLRKIIASRGLSQAPTLRGPQTNGKVRQDGRAVAARSGARHAPHHAGQSRPGHGA